MSLDIPCDASLIAGTDITGEQMRAACVVLAGKALDASDGDWDAAGDMLAESLRAVGALPYEAAHRGPYGRQAPRAQDPT